MKSHIDQAFEQNFFHLNFFHNSRYANAVLLGQELDHQTSQPRPQHSILVIGKFCRIEDALVTENLQRTPRVDVDMFL